MVLELVWKVVWKVVWELVVLIQLGLPGRYMGETVDVEQSALMAEGKRKRWKLLPEESKALARTSFLSRKRLLPSESTYLDCKANALVAGTGAFS
jgi:hypothetical protein